MRIKLGDLFLDEYDNMFVDVFKEMQLQDVENFENYLYILHQLGFSGNEVFDEENRSVYFSMGITENLWNDINPYIPDFYKEYKNHSKFPFAPENRHKYNCEFINNNPIDGEKKIFEIKDIDYTPKGLKKELDKFLSTLPDVPQYYKDLKYGSEYKKMFEFVERTNNPNITNTELEIKYKHMCKNVFAWYKQYKKALSIESEAPLYISKEKINNKVFDLYKGLNKEKYAEQYRRYSNLLVVDGGISLRRCTNFKMEKLLKDSHNSWVNPYIEHSKNMGIDIDDEFEKIHNNSIYRLKNNFSFLKSKDKQNDEFLEKNSKTGISYTNFYAEKSRNFLM